MKLYPAARLTGAVGYMGPPHAPPNPSYRDVCSGLTGHVEVFNCEYSGGDLMFEQLCRHFFSFHDPTIINRQGNDVGTQYASVIFCYDDKQKEIANKVKSEFQSLLNDKKVRFSKDQIFTDIRAATVFYKAEEEHQEYLKYNPGGYCNHFYRIDRNMPH